MANDWLRLWHDMPTDPKWRTIARVSGQSIVLVTMVYVHLLVDASSREDRGSIGISTEDLASACDADEESIAAVLKAMQGRVIAEGRLSGWERRQPSKEDSGARNYRQNPYGSSYVYFVGATDSDVVKVGFSKNPWSRAKDLQTGSHAKYEVLATIKTDERSEFALHKFFEKSRSSGEWFFRSKAINDLIDKAKTGEINSYESCVSYLQSLHPEDFDPTTELGYGSSVATTKDKEVDKEKEVKTKRAHRASLITFSQFLLNCKAKGEKLISDYRPVWQYAESAGLPVEFIELAWDVFYRDFDTGGTKAAKRYTDWRQTFRNYVEKNYLHLWYHNAGTDRYELTTQGRTAQKVAA